MADVRHLNEQLARKTDALVQAEARVAALNTDLAEARAQAAALDTDLAEVRAQVAALRDGLRELYDLAAYAVSPRNATRNAQIQEARRRAIALLNS